MPQTVKAIRVAAYGGPEAMQLDELTIGEPGPGEIRIRHRACGLNFIDVYQRTGLYANPLPLALGMEGAGVVEAVGEGVTHLKAGDRAAYASQPPGAYCEARVMPAKSVCKLPDQIDFETGAAMMLKGLTVQYLLRQTQPQGGLHPGDFVLFHAAAGQLAVAAVTPHHAFQRLGGAAAQAVHGLHVATPHKGQQLADDGVAGRDGDVDLGALHQVGVGLAVDQREHPPRAHALGQQAGHDVVFVVAGQRHEEVHVLDVLVGHQVFVGRVALQHQHVGRQLGGQVLAACTLGLDDLHLAMPGQFARQPQAHLAAAGDHHAAHRLVDVAQRRQHAADVRGGGKHEDLVAGLDAGVAVQLGQRLVLAVDGHDAHRDAGQQQRDLGQIVLHQRPAGHGPHRDQTDQPMGELQHLQGFGVFDQLAHVGGDALLGAQHLIHRQPFLAQQLAAGLELGAAHAGDGGGHAEHILGHLAGHQVGFVLRRAGDQHVGILDTGFHQHAGLDGVADHTAQVQPVPLAAMKLMPVGSVSTTVTVPLVGAAPMLDGVSVKKPVTEPCAKLPGAATGPAEGASNSSGATSSRVDDATFEARAGATARGASRRLMRLTLRQTVGTRMHWPSSQ
jgi:Zn-dependent alcohol dehydrogenase